MKTGRRSAGPFDGPVLALEHVSREFADGRHSVAAVDDVSMTVARGELVAVMGASGSGKSTLLHLSGGLDRPTAGSIRVAGQELAALAPRAMAALRRREIGVVFQEYNLLEAITALENVALPLELDNRQRKQAKAAARNALELVGLGELGDRFPADLSGGERQRVAIARALVGDQPLLLADEPTGALDSVNGEEILRLLRRRCDAGGGALLVTHDARLAAWADRIMFLRDGRCIDQTAPPEEPERLLGVRS
ncbi:MAG: ABC transporter ATP-binding protein [Acidimicrobiales bacterium]